MLDVRDKEAESAERRRKQEAELARAQIAREEAESDVRRLKEEVRRLKKEGDEGRERERTVAKRLEVVRVRGLAAVVSKTDSFVGEAWRVESCSRVGARSHGQRATEGAQRGL